MTSSDETIVTQQTDVISAEELADAIQRWEAPHMVSVSDAEAQASLLDVKAIEALQKQAQEEGYKAGHERGYLAGFNEGQQAGIADIQRQVGLLEQMLMSMQQPLAEMDSLIEQELLQLVIKMTMEVVERELKSEPKLVVEALKAGIKVLPNSDRDIYVYVHPDDLEIVKKGSAQQGSQKYQWVEDVDLTRGGVRIETADTKVDATVESRLHSVINKALGTE